MPGELDGIVQRMIDAGEPEENIALVIQEYGTSAPRTPQPPQSTIGMMQPSTTQGDPKRTEPYLAEEWSAMPTGEKIRNVAQWGAKAILGGIAGPEGIDAAEHPKTTLATAAIPLVAQKVPGILAKAAGISKARGGQNMQTALEAGEGLRVPMSSKAQDATLRARELTGSRNAELNGLLDRLTNPKVTKYRGDDLVVREAQDFITKFGAMSAEDASRLPPVAQRELTTIARELRATLTETLDTVGKGDQYAKGVREFRRASRAAELLEKAAPYLKKLGYYTAAGAGYRGLTSEPTR